MDHVQINHGNWPSWAVQPAMAGRVSDWINHHIWRGSEVDRSVVVRWAYVKELATTNIRERGVGFIKMHTRENVVTNREKKVSMGRR